MGASGLWSRGEGYAGGGFCRDQKSTRHQCEHTPKNTSSTNVPKIQPNKSEYCTSESAYASLGGFGIDCQA